MFTPPHPSLRIGSAGVSSPPQVKSSVGHVSSLQYRAAYSEVYIVQCSTKYIIKCSLEYTGKYITEYTLQYSTEYTLQYQTVQCIVQLRVYYSAVQCSAHSRWQCSVYCIGLSCLTSCSSFSASPSCVPCHQPSWRGHISVRSLE